MSEAAHYRIATRHDLTPRQREVLELIARGHTNPEIAERLGISLEGAKHHVSEILSKLDVTSREEAADWWRATRPSRVSRYARALWPWPVLGATAAALAAVAVAFAVGRSPSDQSGAGNEAETPPPLARCQEGELSYLLVPPNEADGAVYFRVSGTSPQAPCRAKGDVNLVPVPARVDEPVQVAIPIQRNFPPQVDTTIEPGGTDLVYLKWSNWCEGTRAIAWRPMSTLAFAGTAPFIDDSHPDCLDRSQPSTLERLDNPPLLSDGRILFISDSCGEDDIWLSLYEESGWRPGESALLEVQPASYSCSVYNDPLTATLYVDGAFVGTRSIRINAPLQYAGYRVPFRWNGPCNAKEVRLEVTLGLAETTLYPTARPYCEGAPATNVFAAGW
jgi:DNA-binding CsgD family transcriptional regulator